MSHTLGTSGSQAGELKVGRPTAPVSAGLRDFPSSCWSYLTNWEEVTTRELELVWIFAESKIWDMKKLFQKGKEIRFI